MWSLKLGTVVMLIAMIYQDFKYRGIVWWLFPALFVLLAFLSITGPGLVDTVYQLSANVLFIGVQIALLTLYFSIRKKGFTNIFKGLLGTGDLLFLVCIAVYLPFTTFIVFYVLSLLVVIIFTIVTRLLVKECDHKIPLAGYQALLFLALVLPGFLNITMEYFERIDFLKYLLN